MTEKNPADSFAIECPHCEYGITSCAEAVEALESGCACPMCGVVIPVELLEAAAEAWDDFAAIHEGAGRAADGAALAEEEAWESAGPDFGDDGEEDAEDDD